MLKKVISSTGRCAALGTLLLAATLPWSSHASAQDAAMLLPGSINDQSWNAAGYAGLQRIEELGYTISYSENVQSADHVVAMRDYARRGADVVIGHSGRFVSAAERVAPEFEDVQFIVGSGAKGIEPNFRSVEINRAQFSYVTGVMAAMTSETGRVGMVAGLEGLPTIVAHVGGFRLGVHSVDPDAVVEVIYLPNMEDAAAAKEAGLLIFANGGDVVAGILNAGQSGLIQAAQEQGGYAFGRSTGHTDLAPDAVLTNIVDNWAAIYESAAADAQGGSLSGDFTLYGFDTAPVTGASFMYSESQPFGPAVTDEVRAAVEAVIADLADGTVEVTPTPEDARPGT